MTQFRSTIGPDGHQYAKLVGDEWVPISEDEARAAGVWRDPRGGQFAVKDPLATPEQLGSRDKGFYDPRPASGALVATRVKLHCVRCGNHLGNVVEFERRMLFYSRRDQRWRREIGGMKCPCFGGDPFKVDLDAVLARLDVARLAGSSRSINIGDMT